MKSSKNVKDKRTLESSAKTAPAAPSTPAAAETVITAAAVAQPAAVTQPAATATTAGPAAKAKEDAARARRYRKLVELVGRVQVTTGGRKFVRFSAVEVFEHWALLLCFSLLTVTGLFLQFAGVFNLTPIVQFLFRDVDQLSAIHNIGAIGFLGLAIFHAVRIFNLWFVRGETPGLAPSGRDFASFVGLLNYLFHKGGKRPAVGRYSIEEKLTYGWLAVCSLLLVLSALVLWAPVLVSKYLDAIVMPSARVIHSLTGLLVVLTLLPWHLYHTLIRERNTSIFTGVLSEDKMRKNHPLEYQQIMDAAEELRQIQAKLAGGEATAGLNGGAKQPAITAEQAGD
jgi:cytochrome b subunit of formate dehydrogenase